MSAEHWEVYLPERVLVQQMRSEICTEKGTRTVDSLELKKMDSSSSPKAVTGLCNRLQ